MTKIELHEVRNLRQLFMSELERHDQLEASIQGLSRRVDGLPHPRNASSRVEKLALLLTESMRLLDELRERIFAAAVKLTAAFASAEVTPAEREVLSLRYVSALSFQEISRRLNRSIGSVFKLHRLALKRIVDG